jgi:hypothetical protein
MPYIILLGSTIPFSDIQTTKWYSTFIQVQQNKSQVTITTAAVSRSITSANLSFFYANNAFRMKKQQRFEI